MIEDSKRREALMRFKRLDEAAEAHRLRTLDLHARYRDAIHAKQEAERAVSEERQRLARTVQAEPIDPRLEREAEATAAEVERLEGTYAEAQRMWQDSKLLVDACRAYLVEHGANPDAPLARPKHYDDTRSRGAERVRV